MTFLTAGVGRCTEAATGAKWGIRQRAAVAMDMAIAIAIVLAAVCVLPAGAKNSKESKNSRDNWRGVVTHVTDGDTLWVRPEAGGRPRKVRLDGIDAPEICQAHGPVAQQALAQRLMRREVRVDTRRMDDYERALATVTLQGDDVAEWMVSQGHAWSYKYRKDPGRYAAEEKRARAQGVGLFARSDAVRPRDFRKRHGSCYDTNSPGKSNKNG